MFIPVKPNPIPNEVVIAVYRASGIGILDCRKLLQEASPLFYARIVEAATTQGVSIWNERRGLLRDPIEYQPDFAEALQTAGQLAEAELASEYPNWGTTTYRGYCHRFWPTKKRILREKYEIEWFSPAEMNPRVMFD